MSGWLPAPPTDRRLLALAGGVVVLTIPFAWAPLLQQFPVLESIREALGPLIDKTRFGFLRYAHFLSLAYLAYVAVGERGARLTGPVVEMLRRLGQQSLAIFMSGLGLSFLASTLLNVIGRSLLTASIVNASGIVILFAIARATAFFKSQPWSKPVKPLSTPQARSGTIAAGLHPAE